MKIHLDKNTYINFPDKGQKNWATPLTSAFQAMANYLRGRLANAVQGSSNNTFTGNNHFLKRPVIRHSDETETEQNRNNFEVLRRKDLESDRSRQSQNSTNISKAFSLLGSETSNELLEEMQQELLVNDTRLEHTRGSAWHIIKHFLGNASTNANMMETLVALTKAVDGLTPLGIIQPFWCLGPQEFARWEQGGNEDINISGEYVQKGVLANQRAGGYKLAGGMWALCDGRFPLPPNLTRNSGNNANAVTHWIPNMHESYLEGFSTVLDAWRTDGNGNLLNEHNKLGSNEITLSKAQLPAHSHDMAHDHTGTTQEDGEHTHELKWSTYGTDGGRGNERWNNSNAGTPVSATTELSGKHSHTFKTNKYDDPTGNTGDGAAIDPRTNRLRVAYYMRVR